MTDESIVARLDERTKLILETIVKNNLDNDIAHKSISESIKNTDNSIKQLTIHVNHENEKMDKRMTTIELVGSPTVKELLERIGVLEEYVADQQSQKKGANFVKDVVIGILGIAVTIIGILEVFNLL